MIANTAFLAALTTFLLTAWLAGELTFLAPYKAALFREHGMVIAGGVLLVFLNLCAAYYRAGTVALPARYGSETHPCGSAAHRVGGRARGTAGQRVVWPPLVTTHVGRIRPSFARQPRP